MHLLRPGDFVVLAAGLAAVAGLATWSWSGGDPERAVIRVAGQVVESPSLAQARLVSVEGPLGTTRIEIQPGRARVASDPSPRQICVRRGWLTQAGDVALCLPNQVSVEIRGRAAAYDSLGY
jgi:hypothetical protein